MVQIFLLLGSMSVAHGNGISIPPDYFVDKSADEKCSLIKLPERVFGTKVCMYDFALDDAAIQSGFFENEQGRWVLGGPGVPNFPIVRKYNATTLMYGVALCAFEDSSGLHGAGGKCFYGIASIGNHSLNFRSRSIPSNGWSDKDSTAHKKMMHAFFEMNFQRNRFKSGVSTAPSNGPSQIEVPLDPDETVSSAPFAAHASE